MPQLMTLDRECAICPNAHGQFEYSERVDERGGCHYYTVYIFDTVEEAKMFASLRKDYPLEWKRVHVDYFGRPI